MTATRFAAPRTLLILAFLGASSRHAAAQQPAGPAAASPTSSAEPPTASPPPPPVATPPAPAVASLPRPAAPPSSQPAVADHPTSFRAEFKLPFAVSSLYGGSSAGEQSNPFAPIPQLVLGVHSGRFGFGLGLGFTRYSASSVSVVLPGGAAESSTTNSLTEVMVAPTVTGDVFQSDDGKVALYLLGAPILGDIIETGESSKTDFGFQFALGANLALHDNFHVGLEVGPVGHFYTSPGDGGAPSSTVSSVTLYTALVGTFVYPR